MDQTTQDFKIVAKTDVTTACAVIRQWWQEAKLPRKEEMTDDLPTVLRAVFHVKDRLDEARFEIELGVKEERGATMISISFLYNLYVRTANDVAKEVVCGMASEFKKRNIECEVRTGFLLRHRR